MTRKTVPRISETEWEVMRAVWAGHPATAGEIIARLCRTDPSWHPKTAQTLLARLVKKGVLDYEKRGRAHVYAPILTEEQCVAAASRSFLQRVFGGALKPMLAHFVKQQKLTEEEVGELEELLARRRR
jgi:BlaI family penicillinase repressor